MSDISEPDSGQTKAFNRDWLKEKTRAELVDLLLAITLELKSRAEKDTTKVSPPGDDKALSFATVSDFLPEKFSQLPLVTSKDPALALETTWKIVLVSANSAHPPLGLIIIDDISIGRADDEISPDLDLTDYAGIELGVSREHAKLRPTSENLVLYDLGSANGTYCNGIAAKLGAPLIVRDGDVISFGHVHFKLTVISKPKS